MAASPRTCPAPPASYYKDIGNSQQAFQRYLGDGTFRLKPGWSLAFTHAVLHVTTGNRGAITIGIRVQTGSAGELWNSCSGDSVTDEKCGVYNCLNRNCSHHCSPQQARATAHVYST